MLGERLRALRLSRGLTQRQLAARMFLPVNTISSYAHDADTPDDATKIWLAEYFDVSLDYLMGLTDIPLPLSSSRLVRIENPPSAPSSESHEERKDGHTEPSRL